MIKCHNFRLKFHIFSRIRVPKVAKTWFSTLQIDCKLCMFHRPSFTKYRKNHEKPQKLDKISEQKCVQNDHIFGKKKQENMLITNSQTCANDHHSVMYDAVSEGEIMIIIFPKNMKTHYF